MHTRERDEWQANKKETAPRETQLELPSLIPRFPHLPPAEGGSTYKGDFTAHEVREKDTVSVSVCPIV